MRLFYSSLFVFFFLLAHFSSGQTPSRGGKTESNRIFIKIKDISNEYVTYPNTNKEVVLNADLKKIINTYQISAIAPAFPTTEKSDPRLKRIYTVSFPVATQREAILSALRRLPFMEYTEMIPVYEIFFTPNDLNPQQWNLPKINATGAWDLSKGGGAVIAIVDDACRLTHEDLAANIWTNPLEIAGNGIDDDNDGYIDDMHGYDVADNDNNPMVPATATNSEFTHGTHCSGIAAAVSNNGKGIASISYSNKIMAVKCKQSSDAGGSLPYAYSGLGYAILSEQADVISMSWGGYAYSATFQLLFDIAYDAGIVCVAAAGNSNTDIPMYPASYNHVISVAATDPNDQRAYFSNYGNTVDVSAPGVDIYSTLAGSNTSYGTMSGTSMACPLVSGLCGLMLSYNPMLTPDELEKCLKDNADNIDNLNPGYAGSLGAGRINAYRSMMCLQKTPTAAFKSDKQLVCPGQTVTYTDMSALGVNSGVTWNWSFPGGIPATSTNQNPTVVYNTAGTYTATLKVTNTFGNSVETKTNYITVSALTAVLSGSASIPAGGNALLKVVFSNSTGPYSITYTDGITSVNKTNITANPYYFTVTPAQTSTYTLTGVSTAYCNGTYSGSAVITLGNFASTTCSGSSSIMFERAYGNADGDNGNNIIQSAAGDNYLIGMTGANTSDSKFSISKLDASWNIVWTKNIGTNAGEYIYNSTKSTDGNIIICGTSTVNGNLDAYVAKVDFNGNIIWSNTYGDTKGAEYGFSIQNTTGGGYILGGRTESYSGTLDGYVVKITSTGALEWSTAYGRGYNDYTFAGAQTADGGYITASASQSNGFSNYDYLLTKLTSTGSISWAKYYGSGDDEGPRKLIITADGGFLLGGHSRYRDSQGDAMLTKIDANGNLLWARQFGGNGGDDGFVVKESSDGNYLIAGVSNSYGAGGLDIYLSKFDTNGNVLWKKLYGGAQNDNFPSMGNIINASDGGYMVVGGTSSFGAGNGDMYLIKTDCNGNTGCSSIDAPFQNYTVAPVLYDATMTDMNAPDFGSITATSTNINLSATSKCASAACVINSDFYASDTIVCKGTAVTFTSTSTGASAYKWYLNNTVVSTNTSFSNVFSTEGDYKIILEVSKTGCSDIDTLIISVKPDPKLTVSKDTTICNTTSANLLVSGASTYSWTSAQGLSCTTCTNPVATPPSTRYYYVAGTDVNGCTSKDSVKIIVKCCVNGKTSPKAGFSFSDTIICVNDIIAVTNLSYTSINNVSAEWDFSSAGIPQASTAIQPGNVQFTQAGRWPVRLIITDNCGKDTIINYINVFNPPVVDAYPDVYLCSQNNQVRFDITPVSDYDYKWIPSFGLSDPTIANPTVALTDTSILYTRTIRDNNTGCTTIDAVKVSSHTSFQIRAMNDTSIVAGQGVTLKACCGNYTWSPSAYLNNPNSQHPIATPYSSMWYYVQSVDTIGCIARDSVFIIVKIPEPYIPNLITPNGDQFNDTFEIKNLCPGSHVEIYNRWGNLVFKSEDYKNDWDARKDSDGMYYITFQSGCGGKVYKSWLQVLGGN